MNKKIIISLVALVLFGLTSNAQVFIGGGIGLDFLGGKETITQGGNSSSTDDPTNFSFSFEPKVGYFINDDFAIGLQFGIGMLTSKEKQVNGNITTTIKENTFLWGVKPFVLYKMVGNDKLGLFLEGAVPLLGAVPKRIEDDGTTTTTTKGLKTFSIGVGISPVLVYNITDKLSLEASSDFLRLGFESTIIKNVPANSGDMEYKHVQNHFGFGINDLGNAIKLGLVLKF